MPKELIVRDTLEKISKMERFNQWIYENIKPFLGDRILDAGCGNGNISEYFKDKELLIAVDKDEDNIKDIQGRLSGFTNLQVIKCDIEKDQFVSLVKERQIDTILCINTLEHIKDDVMVIRNLYDILEPDGSLIILVPVLRFLYSSLDKSLGHFRRYSKEEIIQKLTASNFHIQYTAYFNFFGIFGWFLHSKLLRKSRFSGSALNLFDSLVKYFVLFERFLRIPFGLSLLVVGRKMSVDLDNKNPGEGIC
ncbi:MAG: class I SAM-dependent methyltransferase [Candidatus Omnitrophota bacterium]